MSPALLSQRLKELEAAGIVARDAATAAYRLTPAGRELEPLVEAFGIWGQRWIESELSLEHLDAQLLMWDMRRGLDPSPLPPRRTVIQFRYPELPENQRRWWLLVDPGREVDLCSVDPGFDVDLYVSADLRAMTAVWMGYESIARAVEQEKVVLTGAPEVASQIQRWLALSPFAKHARLAA